MPVWKSSDLERDRIVRSRFEALQRAGDEAAQCLQRGVGARQVRGAGRQLAVGALRRLAHEGAGALDRGGGNAGPSAAPDKMRDRHHGLGVNLVVAHRQNLLALAPDATSLKPALQVPRMPSASQPIAARACNPA